MVIAGIEIEFDTEEERIRAEALQEGLVWAGIEDGWIDIWWSSGKNRGGVLSEQLKSLGGKKITNGGGHLQLTLTNCRSLREVFGDQLEISDDLHFWALDEIERLGSIENLSTAASDAELSPLIHHEAPRIARMAHAYQRAGISFCATTKRALLADQPGLGKTLQTIGAIIEAGIEGDILIAAPSAAVAITWPHELAQWIPDEQFIAVMGTGKIRHATFNRLGIGQTLPDLDSTDVSAKTSPAPITGSSKRRWFIINLEMARSRWIKPTKEFRAPKVGKDKTKRWFNVEGWWAHAYPELHNHTWSAIVVDESHRALITHSAIPQGQTQIRAGMGMLKLAEGGLKLALSGTPMRGKPENLWGTLNWLYPDVYPAYWDWAERWFIVFGDPRSSREIEGLDETRTKAFYQDIKTIMLRRTKKEVRPELPDKLYAGTPLPDESGFVDENSPVGHWVEMSAKQAKAYAEIREQAETMLESGILTANGLLAELVRCKQFAICHGDIIAKPDRHGDVDYKFLPQMPSSKFDWLVEFLDGLGINKNSTMELEEDGEEEVRKVVVASQFTEILNLYSAELTKLGIENMMITGKVTQTQRKKNAERWQKKGGPGCSC